MVFFNLTKFIPDKKTNITEHQINFGKLKMAGLKALYLLPVDAVKSPSFFI